MIRSIHEFVHQITIFCFKIDFQKIKNMISKNKPTMFLFLLVLPVNIFLPSFAYFFSLGIFTVLLLLKFVSQNNILRATTTLTLSLVFLYVFPNVYVLFVTNLISLLLLFQQLLPTYTFYKIIELISFMLLLRYMLQTYMLLTISIVGMFALLRYDLNLRSTVRCYISYGLVVFSASAVSLILLPLVIVRPWNIKNILLGAYIASPLSRCLGIKWEIRNKHNMLLDHESAVIVSNHQTALDMLGMFYFISRLKIRCTAVGRKLIFYIWPFGLTLWLCGVVFINRRPNFQKTHLQMNEAAELIEEQQAKIWIFPEGTRNKNFHDLFPFKKGAFRMAIKNQIPIIPVIFSPYYFVDWQTKRFQSGKIIIDIMPAIRTEGLSYNEMDELIENTHSSMKRKCKELAEEIRLYNLIES